VNPNLSQPAMMVAVAIALTAVVTDLRTRTVPNALVACGALAGFAVNVWTLGGTGAVRSIGGMAAGLAVFLPFFLLRGMGAGDVKLMGALGACLGALAVLQTALVAAFAGAILAVAAALRGGMLARTLANTGRLLGSWVRRGPRPSEEMSLDNPRALKIPYALPIAAGALFIVFSRS